MTQVLAFFNNKGGVGKTSLVYHLSWMFADLGLNVVAADLDPQANLTAAFLDEERLEELWPDGKHAETVFAAIEPLKRGVGDIAEPHVEPISDMLGLVVGDLQLSTFEDELAQQWPKCLDRDERAFRVQSAFWRVLQHAARLRRADLVLLDVGPNLGAINRSALIAANWVVVPLAPDLFSLQGLRNLGPSLREWRQAWSDRRSRQPQMDVDMPEGMMQPAGYVVLQHSERLNRPVKAYQAWNERIPQLYDSAVLGRPAPGLGFKVFGEDLNCLSRLKHYRSLMPMAQEAHKPIFHLKPADGAIGAHFTAVQDVYKDFRALAMRVAQRIGVPLP